MHIPIQHRKINFGHVYKLYFPLTYNVEIGTKPVILFFYLFICAFVHANLSNGLTDLIAIFTIVFTLFTINIKMFVLIQLIYK